MGATREFSSENARNVILRHRQELYYVGRVSVSFREGESTQRAVFHARRATDSQSEDLELEITRKLYDVLVEYAKLDNFGQILILQIDGKESRWCLISENWFKQCRNGKDSRNYVI